MSEKIIDRTVYASQTEAEAARPEQEEGAAKRKLFSVQQPEGYDQGVVYTYAVNASDALYNVSTAYGFSATCLEAKKGGLSRAAVLAGSSDAELVAQLTARGIGPKEIKKLLASTTASNGAAAPSETAIETPAA